MTTIQIISLVVVLAIAAALIGFVRGRVLKEKYVWLWLFLDLLALIFVLWPQALYAMSRVLGFDVPSNLVFFGVIAVLVIVEIHQAIAVSRLEEERRRLAEEIAYLRHDVDALHR
ncbi:DUF2304 domain-containing protein [Trueperella pecoris]|uniref:DUF2304 domain-containing protein n=1 Tax=Trueperella pecoris TaxID=2733571 RepID=UPI001ABE9B36|nr:DUF2304 domain-containing protein [Trueperella pecoris]QTG76038.1 DUF2304 domain-containing protein [Trueperella pecoris]